jgi:2-succinyl-6-hydroxy-2,4-cyclohexadiene-1-carboxylate synthase
LTHWERLPLFASQKQLAPAVLVEQATIRRRNTASGLASSLKTCGLAQMPDYWEHLASLTHPIRLVVGQHDQRFVEIAQHMCTALPNASVELVQGCGHNVPLEAPAALAALIQASL